MTDVYLLMGILDPSTYLGGTLKLDAGRSAKIVTDNLAAPLGVSLDEALARMEDAYLDESPRRYGPKRRSRPRRRSRPSAGPDR